MMRPKQLLYSIGLFALNADLSLAYWRMACSVSQTSRADPILNPGEIAGHAHKFAGGNSVSEHSNFDTLFASSCSSCQIQDDKSAYWTPMLYFAHSNGSFEEVQNDGMTVYYVGRGGDATNTAAFPPGFQMISGDTTARSYNTTALTYLETRPQADRVSFRCINEANNIPETHYLDQTDCVHGLRAQLNFQSCWDGINLYLHESAHVAYLSGIDYGVCPPSHPIPIPGLFFEVLYWTNRVDQSGGGRFVFSNGDATGYGFHGDFMNGWEMNVQQAAVENCLYVDHGGVISRCDELEKSNDINFPRTCPEQPSNFDEQVKGMLRDALPGCNPITDGPENAPQEICPLNVHSLGQTSQPGTTTISSSVTFIDTGSSTYWPTTSTVTSSSTETTTGPQMSWTTSTELSSMYTSTLTTTSLSIQTESSSWMTSTTSASTASSTGLSNGIIVETVTVTLTERLTIFVTVFPSIQQTAAPVLASVITPAAPAPVRAVPVTSKIVIPETTITQPKSTSTVPSSVFIINTLGIETTVVMPESTIVYSERTITVPASTVTVTETAPISTIILPGTTVTQSTTTITITAPTTTLTTILPGSTVTIPGSTITLSADTTLSSPPNITRSDLSTTTTASNTATLSHDTGLTQSNNVAVSPGNFVASSGFNTTLLEPGRFSNTSTSFEETTTTTTTIITSTIFVTNTPTTTATSTTTLGLGLRSTADSGSDESTGTDSAGSSGTTVTTFVTLTTSLANEKNTTTPSTSSLLSSALSTNTQSTTKFTIKGREILHTGDGNYEVDMAESSQQSTLRGWSPEA